MGGDPLSDAGLGRRWPRAKSTGKGCGAVYCAAADCAHRTGEKARAGASVFNGSRLPQDRESLFWFNLLDIPPEPKNGKTDNYLQLAIRSRIKLFYRPAGVAAEKIAAEKALSWALAPTGNGLRVSNASARYITIDSITLNGKKHAAGMVAPFSSLEIAPKRGRAAHAASQIQLHHHQ